MGCNRLEGDYLFRNRALFCADISLPLFHDRSPFIIGFSAQCAGFNSWCVIFSRSGVWVKAWALRHTASRVVSAVQRSSNLFETLSAHCAGVVCLCIMLAVDCRAGVDQGVGQLVDGTDACRCCCSAPMQAGDCRKGRALGVYDYVALQRFYAGRIAILDTT